MTSTVLAQSSNVFVIPSQGGTGTPGGTGPEGPLGPSVSYWLYLRVVDDTTSYFVLIAREDAYCARYRLLHLLVNDKE